MKVALLAGGTGGAKLAVGLRDILHGFDDQAAELPGRLDVIANTADDIEIYDVHVSPDPDLITFRLAGALNAAGYGIEGETHTLMDARRATGEDVWFELGDDDMAVCAERARLLNAGVPLTEAHAKACAAYPTGGARVLPISDDPVRTLIETEAGTRGIQQFLIQDRSEPEILGVKYAGIESAVTTSAVLDAITEADLIIVGPSNPIISVAPIMLVSNLWKSMRDSAAPVLGVSPFVGGAVLKGPTVKFVESAGFEATSKGVADYYESHFPACIDAWIADDHIYGHAHHLAGVEMSSPEQTRAVAAEVLRYGASLAPTEAAA
jgi:LPPG:FO 2-phospho-L-lactate transferase